MNRGRATSRVPSYNSNAGARGNRRPSTGATGQKSAKGTKNPKGPKSVKNPKGPKSVKNPKGPKSVKNPKGPKSVKNPKGPKSVKISEISAVLPQLVIGMVAPIGCNLSRAESSLKIALNGVNYDVEHIKLTDSFDDLIKHFRLKKRKLDLNTMEGKIEAGNEIRKKAKKEEILAFYAMSEIRERRKKIARKMKKAGFVPKKNVRFPDIRGVAYVISQFKRPEEIQRMKRIYGDAFVQISVVDNLGNRTDKLISKLREEGETGPQEKMRREAQKLMEKDEDEVDNDFGQRLAKTFQSGDFFLDVSDLQAAEFATSRFINAFFGRNDISPTLAEFGNFIAKSASLRSVDLSRQVGAAIMAPEGDIVCFGCNEVPKPGGGIFSDEDAEPIRDIDLGRESNRVEKDLIANHIVEILWDKGLLKGKKTLKKLREDETILAAIKEARIAEITEYGRMVHAEMNALMDAARRGVSVRNATMYVTTFPCHNCAKHIISAGISKVVFVEPYPKSRTRQLFRGLISGNPKTVGAVQFSHFVGISAKRFLDIFSKSAPRTDKFGRVQEWNRGIMQPRLGVVSDYRKMEAESVEEEWPI